MNKYSSLKLASNKLDNITTNLSSPCNIKKISLWLVLLDNIPTLILVTLGTIIIDQVSTIGAVIFAIYIIFSVIFFWARICTFCHHYNTFACPCGYGAISARLFKKRTDKSFKKVFKQNIWIVFPNWIIPFAFAIYLLLTQYTKGLLNLAITFSLIGFVIIPLVSKFVGCKNCETKEDCPWMSVNKEVQPIKCQQADLLQIMKN